MEKALKWDQKVSTFPWNDDHVLYLSNKTLLLNITEILTMYKGAKEIWVVRTLHLAHEDINCLQVMNIQVKSGKLQGNSRRHLGPPKSSGILPTPLLRPRLTLLFRPLSTRGSPGEHTWWIIPTLRKGSPAEFWNIQLKYGNAVLTGLKRTQLQWQHSLSES